MKNSKPLYQALKKTRILKIIETPVPEGGEGAMHESSSTKIGIFMIFIPFCTLCQNAIGQHTPRKKHEIAWEVFLKMHACKLAKKHSEKGILSSHLT